MKRLVDVGARAAIVRGLEGQLPTAPNDWLQPFEEGHIVAQHMCMLEG